MIASVQPTGVSTAREEFLRACGAAYDRLLPPDGPLPRQTLAEMEDAADGLFRFLGALLIEKRLRADELAQADREFPCPQCGRRMRIQQPDAEREGRKLVDACAKRLEAWFSTPGRTPRASGQAVPLLVVTCDGGKVQTRNEHERWKETKVGCVYDTEPCPEPRAPTAEKYRGAQARTKTYVATVEPWETLGRMLFVEACTRGYLAARTTLFISDAANGILTLHADHFPDAVLIIDWYHAADHLSKSAKAAFPASPAQSTQWFETQKTRLWDGQVRRVARAVRAQSERLGPPPPKSPDTDPRVVLHRDVGYFTDHQQAMDYPTYRAKGWPIGSGVAEASVKQFGLRVKGSEKFWNVWGAEEMLALCALQSSEDGRWATYWKARSTPPPDAERFYASTP